MSIICISIDEKKIGNTHRYQRKTRSSEKCRQEGTGRFSVARILSSHKCNAYLYLAFLTWGYTLEDKQNLIGNPQRQVITIMSIDHSCLPSETGKTRLNGKELLWKLPLQSMEFLDWQSLKRSNMKHPILDEPCNKIQILLETWLYDWAWVWFEFFVV